MAPPNPVSRLVFAIAMLVSSLVLRGEDVLPGTEKLTGEGDRSAEMVAGISRFLDAQIAAAVTAREQFWRPDFSSPAAYENSVAPNRARLARMIGVIDQRQSNPEMEFVATATAPAKIAETGGFTVFAVRWPVLDGVFGEGLWLRPKGRVLARVIVLPDADQTPEMLVGLAPGISADKQFARRLADSGCEVIVPTLIDRSDRFSGNPRIDRATNQPHREWIYRQAFVMGRHVIGYEVQKVMAAVDGWTRAGQEASPPIGVAGVGEGGLIALYTSALDTRIAATLVSGYFGNRQDIWREPIYRNVFGLLREFGDAEIARLIVPRALAVDSAAAPEIPGPPAIRPRAAGAAPGRIVTPREAEVRAEVERAKRLAGVFSERIAFPNSAPAAALTPFLQALAPSAALALADGTALDESRTPFDPSERQHRQVGELERFTQSLLPLSRGVREQFLWKKVPPTTPAAWQTAMQPYREKLWRDVLGRFEIGDVPAHPRSRQILERPKWTGYEVMLDVLPEVYAWGYLLLPKGMKPGEKRPVVVTQHGLEGVPMDVITDDPKNRAYGAYKAFAAQLADRGFIVFAPHNPYRGNDEFRLLQRKANPLGKSLFSIILAQHERILDWLATQPNVDPARIGFYGLSYGGKTAMRVPALLDRYALSICSGDFNEWIWKNVTTNWTGSYLFTKEWEMPEFDLGNTFGYAEMAALIAPRPFMVERGHDDGVGLDEWVAFEYAKVGRLYARLGIPERTRIEFFAGPHTIHGVGTFEFLNRHLNWPEPSP